MDMTPPNDLPIPKCFSHLVVVNVGDGEECQQRLGLNIDHLIQCQKICSESLSLSFRHDCECDSNQHSGKENNYTNMKFHDVPFKSAKTDQSSNQCYLTTQQNTITEESENTVLYSHPENQSKFDHQGSNSETESTITMCNYKSTSNSSHSIYFEEYSSQPKEHKNPFVKLNSSLMKLQKEMKDLRFLDISLFCQLMSLQESIQDLKLTMSDRYSDAGSEFSLGTASYMGSMSSLNEESDWEENGPSDVFDQSKDLDFDSSINESQASASDLLKQITDLALRVEEDF